MYHTVGTTYLLHTSNKEQSYLLFIGASALHFSHILYSKTRVTGSRTFREILASTALLIQYSEDDDEISACHCVLVCSCPVLYDKQWDYVTARPAHELYTSRAHQSLAKRPQNTTSNLVKIICFRSADCTPMRANRSCPH